MTSYILLAWLKLVGWGRHLYKAEPKRLRHRFLHVAARLVRCGTPQDPRDRQHLPWTDDIITASSVNQGGSAPRAM
jgi:hypothetical protein